MGRSIARRDVVHRRDAVVELRQSAEQLADVHVLRTVHGANVSRMNSKYEGFALADPDWSLIRTPLARKLRSAVSNWWWCVSTKPGITTLPRASICAAPPACRFGPTARIFFPSTSTSALANSPLLGMLGSIVITWPPRMT